MSGTMGFATWYSATQRTENDMRRQRQLSVNGDRALFTFIHFNRPLPDMSPYFRSENRTIQYGFRIIKAEGQDRTRVDHEGAKCRDQQRPYLGSVEKLENG